MHVLSPFSGEFSCFTLNKEPLPPLSLSDGTHRTNLEFSLLFMGLYMCSYQLPVWAPLCHSPNLLTLNWQGGLLRGYHTGSDPRRVPWVREVVSDRAILHVNLPKDMEINLQIVMMLHNESISFWPLGLRGSKILSNIPVVLPFAEC